METISRLGVVVGVDGSAASDVALEWAIEDARSRGLPLHLVHARGVADWWLMSGAPVPPELVTVPDHVLEERVARVERSAPSVPVSFWSALEDARETLIERSSAADVVVVGARGAGTDARLWLGSIPVQVVTHASCPVVVVRPPHPLSVAHPQVVVGVDGSATCAEALGFAFEHASAHSLGLTAVHAWAERDPSGLAPPTVPEQDPQAIEQQRHLLVSEALAGWRGKYPDVPVREHVLEADPVEALLAEAPHAELLVVGSRGLGGFAGLLLGSVSRAVLKRATCTVAVVRARESGR
jgi:nucleotide-binding universal stress UspA family protein